LLALPGRDTVLSTYLSQEIKMGDTQERLAVFAADLRDEIDGSRFDLPFDKNTTYSISANGRAIVCWRCSKVSHSADDVRELYCGFCHLLHVPTAAS
jgi:hypothetical protein